MIALGTAQFGLDYGLTNKAGKVPQAEVNAILNYATQSGISTVDTAAAYGNSELVLGQYEHLSNFKVVTKIPSLSNTPERLESIAQQSLNRLNLPTLHAILFHDANDLLSREGATNFARVQALKEAGVCKKIGVSVYTPEQLIQICDRYPIEIVQIPYNCFDQRFAQSNCRKLYSDLNIEVHARSVFLQGTLLTEFKTLPAYFAQFKPAFSQFSDLCNRLMCAPTTLSLANVEQADFIDQAVIGVCSKVQLTQVLEHYLLAKQLLTSQQVNFEALKYHDSNLINPVNWPIT